MTKLLLGITSHGFGHLAQSVPVISALRRQRPDIDLTVRTSLPHAVVEGRIAPPFKLVATDQDFGLVMQSPFEVNRSATYARYAALHGRYEKVVDELSRWIDHERFDCVISNVSYIVLEAAHRVGVPSLAMSSLNWFDLFQHYCASFERSIEIAKQIGNAYKRASVFCRLSPGMPMAGFVTTSIVESIAEQGRSHWDELKLKYELPCSARIIVFAFGGISPELPPPWDKRIAREHLVFGPASWCGHDRPWRDPVTAEVPFVDIVASADMVITKAGYGIVTEAAAAGVPVLFIRRGDWPEELYLIEWLSHHVRHAYFEGLVEDLSLDEILSRCDELAAPRPAVRRSTGGEVQIAAILRRLLDGN
jgi:hypothetical protein